MTSFNRNAFPAVATGVPKNPFSTESKLDDIIWFLQKMTGPSLLLFSCIIGVFIVTNQVTDSRVKSAQWIFQISMGSGLLSMGVNVTGLLAFARNTKLQKNIVEPNTAFISQEAFTPVHAEAVEALPSPMTSSSEDHLSSVSFPVEESRPPILTGEEIESPSFPTSARESQWIA